MKQQCVQLNLQPTDYFLMKTIQLYEMIVVRHGLMTVGQPFSGKSASLQVLAGALTDLHAQGVAGALFSRIQVRIINPKAITMGQLYGEVDKATQEWKDGVLAVTFRQLASDPSDDRKWLVLDGPVDAIWIENMNTVLDDNKKLCLPNSEIIQMSPTMSMIFEVGDLAAASPATVSRCGMVYLEPHQLGWMPLLTSWLALLPRSLSPKLRRHLELLFMWLLPGCLRFVRKEVKEICPTEDTALVQGTMRLMSSLMDEFQPPPEEEGGSSAPGPSLDEASKQQLLEGLFLFSVVWSCGATGDGAGRNKFNDFFRTASLGGVPPGYEEYFASKPPLMQTAPIPLEGSSTVYDYCFDKAKLRWQLWTDTLPALAIPPGSLFSDLIIPTKDSARPASRMEVSSAQQQQAAAVKAPALASAQPAGASPASRQHSSC
ncbi:hypothetical protein QJQ45_029706 [Haematococcus lacustris]|nr:hypothetical protein QJQ45_029706 [Haematococcus lacustris]